MGLARSDNPGLRQPAPPDAELTTVQIEELVRRAVEEAGGLQRAIRRDAAWVAIKVNIVEVRAPGSGVITDARVVRAVVKLAHEAAPAARISIVEGSPPSPAAWVLEGARWVVNPSTLVGVLEGGLRALGDSTRSTVWLTGVTGFAFRLAVSDSLAWTDPGIDGLVPDLDAALRQCEGAGYRLELVSGSDRGPDGRDRLEAIWERVVSAIDQGRPAILRRWGTFLVRGYDPRRTDYLLSTWEGFEQVPFDEIAADDGSFVAIFFDERVEVDATAAERAKAALQQAATLCRGEAEVLAAMQGRFGFEAVGDPQRVKGIEEQRAGAAMILQALAAEEQAIAAIERALAR